MYRILHEQQKETADCLACPSMTSSVILAGVHMKAYALNECICSMRPMPQWAAELDRGYWSWGASLVAQRLKRLPTMWKAWVWSLDWEDPLEKELATHSSILAWRIPWTEEPGVLQSTGSHRVGHDWVTSLSLLIMKGLYARLRALNFIL